MLLISSPSLACWTARLMARQTFCTRDLACHGRSKVAATLLAREDTGPPGGHLHHWPAAISSCSAVSMSKGANCGSP